MTVRRVRSVAAASDWLTIGIPTYNRRTAVLEVIDSAQEVAPILIVDDGSDDGTAAALAGIGGLRLVQHETNLGYARAYMRRFAECDSE